MSAVTVVDGGHGARRPRRSWRVKVAATVIAAAIGAVVVGLRLGDSGGATRVDANVAPTRFVPPPKSAEIAAAWGIQITGMFMEADRGLIDLRYQVVDPAKSGRIHGGSPTNPDPNAAVKALPTFVDENNGRKVYPTSAMLHFEHFHFQTELLGNTYSIIYGNSGGALHIGDRVTIVMADGLKLRHVVVTN
jgi:hypothetical protein